VIESEADWRARIAAGGVFDRVRLCGGVGARLALMDEGFEVDTTPLVASGPLELLRLTREQAVSVTGHRHGNLERQTLVSRVGS